MNASEFGKNCGYDRSSILAVEQGKREVGEELCERICDRLGVNREWIKDDTDMNGISDCDEEEGFCIERIFVDIREGADGIHPGKAMDPGGQGERLRRVYESSGLSQRDFCKEAGLTISNMHAVMNGDRKLSARYAEKIENRFGVGVDWLLYGNENTKENPCDSKMIDFLKNHPEIRKAVRKMMEEGC